MSTSLSSDSSKLTEQHPALSGAFLSQLKPLVTFAQGLLEDYDAVKAGMTFEWTNGIVEAQINLLKMLMRQIYGRASLENLIILI